MSGNETNGAGLGLKEEHIHDVFGASKTNSSDFIYNHSKQIYQILDAHCSDSHAKKPPLLVIGVQWTGKSSLLSNWFALRSKKKVDSLTVSRYAQDEFIFWHSVGSSRSSCYEVNLIHRLFCDLNSYFDLSREVPAQTERLRWVLPRLLQAASRKGRMIVIIIDGVDRLVPDEEDESPLSWLPMEPLSNVKIILSATVPSDSPLFRNKETLGAENGLNSDRFNRDSKLNEPWRRSGKSGSKAAVDAFEYEATQRSGTKLLRLLERRPLQILRLRHLEKKLPERLVVAYIKKTVEVESMSASLAESVSEDVILNGSTRDSATPADTTVRPGSAVKQGRIKGFLLFPCHLQALLSSHLSSNAYFLRLVLTFTYTYCKLRGCSVWPLWSRLTAVTDIPSLLDTIFKLIDSSNDLLVENQAQEKELELARTCGGVHTLLDLYPWHPGLQRLRDTFFTHLRADASSSRDDDAGGISRVGRNTAAATAASGSDKQLVELNDLMRRVSTPLLGSAHNKLTESTNHVRNILCNVDSGSYYDTVRLLQSVPNSAAHLSHYATQYESIDDDDTELCDESESSDKNELSFLSVRLIQEAAKEKPTCALSVEERRVNDDKKRQESEQTQKLIEWLDPHLSELIPSNLLCSSTDQAVTGSVWKESASLFGTALCFLYVSRHGLQEEELFKLLAQHTNEITNATIINPGIRRVRRGAKLFDNQTCQIGTSRVPVRQLSTQVTETLTKLLETVGVLHSNTYKILNFPPSDDALRNAVFRNYICPSGGPVVWHRRLISYFKALPVCIRRCEELPWHLERVHQWFELKKTLTHLPTFKQMVGSHLKNEFMRYWLLLSRGPMPVGTDGSSSSCWRNESPPSTAENTNIAQLESVRRLEQVVLSGYSHRTIRRQELQGYVAPFDIVQEMNASVERWKASVSPTDSELKDVLMQVGDFLREFSQRLGPGPLFLRPSIDLKFFTLLGITVADLSSSAQAQSQSRAGSVLLSETSNVILDNNTAIMSRSRANSFRHSGQFLLLETESKETEAMNEPEAHAHSEQLTSFPTAHQIKSHLFPYLRWVWMQLPWLSLDKVKAIGKKALLEKQRQENGARPRHFTTAEPQSKRPLRICDAPSKEMSDESDEALQYAEFRAIAPAGLIVSQKLLKRLAVLGIIPNGTSAVDKTSSLSGPTLGSSSSKQTLDLGELRSLSYSASASDMEISGGQSLSMTSYESSVDTTLQPQTAPNTAARADRGLLASANKKTNRFKYRRSLEEEEEANRGIKFSDHSMFNRRRHSLFPSVERATQDEFKKAEQSDEELYSTAIHILRLGGKTVCDDLNLYTKLDALAEDDLMREYSMIHQSSAPMTKDEIIDAKQTAQFTRGRLLQDHAAYAVKCKLKSLQQLQTKLKQKEEESKRAQEASAMTMDCLHELQSKYQDVSAIVNEETLIKHGYLQILDVLDKNPANSEHQLAEIEQHVQLGQQQLQDLIRFRKKAIDDSERANRFRIRQLETKIEYFHEARELLKVKRKKFLEKYHLREDDLTDVLQSLRAPTAVTTADPSASHHRRYEEEDDCSEDGAAKAEKSLAADSVDGSFKLIRDALSKSLARAKRHESHEAAISAVALIDAANERAIHSFNSMSALFQTIKDRYEGSTLFTGDQFIQEAVMTLDSRAIKRLSDENSKEYQRIVHKLTVDYLLHSTCSRDEEDFLQRIRSNEDLHKSLQSTLRAADEKCGGIRSELELLQRTLNAITTSCGKDDERRKSVEDDIGVGMLKSMIPDSKRGQTGTEEAKSHQSEADGSNIHVTHIGSPIDASDDVMMEKTRQLNLLRNQLSHNQKLVLDATTGIKHIIHGLQMNARLLHSLPRSNPPTLTTDEDISAALGWIEEKLVAINEAMVIDETTTHNAPGKELNQTIGADEISVAQRQQRLAVQVQHMLKLGDPSIISPKSDPKQIDSKSNVLSKQKSIHTQGESKYQSSQLNDDVSKRQTAFSEPSRPTTANTSKVVEPSAEQKQFVSSKYHIVVKSPEERDGTFNDEMKKLHLRQDKEVQEQEAQRREREALLNRPRNVHKFIDDALATPESRKLLRQAKRLSRHVKGPQAFSRYGITLDALLGNRKSVKPDCQSISAAPVTVSQKSATDSDGDFEQLSSKHLSRADAQDD